MLDRLRAPDPIRSEHGQGVPSHIQEVGRWLQDQGHLEVSLGATGEVTVGARASSMTHGMSTLPPLFSIVQTQVDQLPAALVMVLRCAAALGTVFGERLLLRLLEYEVEVTEASLHQQLVTLQSLQFVSLVSDPAEDGGDSDGAHQWEWQVGKTCRFASAAVPPPTPRKSCCQALRRSYDMHKHFLHFATRLCSSSRRCTSRCCTTACCTS